MLFKKKHTVNANIENDDTRQAIYNVFSNAFNDEEDDILKYDEIPTAAEIEANYSPIAAKDLKGKNIG